MPRENLLQERGRGAPYYTRESQRRSIQALQEGTQTATMDQMNISPETSQALQNLSARDKQDLNQFIVNETQKAQIQQTIHSLTDTYVHAR